MAGKEEFKIRMLPRSDEASRPDHARTGKRKVTKASYFQLPPRNTLIFGTVIFLLSLAVAYILRAQPKSHEMSSQKVLRDPTAAKISKLVEDVKVKEDFLRRQRELENLKSIDIGSGGDPDVVNTSPENARSFGVQMDSENTADRLYEELHERPAQTDNTPDARINALLEKNKWLNEQEREERIQYVRNFIKTAYDRGYEVELDQNLQVVGIKPIANRRISLDQAIEKANRR